MLFVNAPYAVSSVRPGRDSNPRVTVLQTVVLPLHHQANAQKYNTISLAPAAQSFVHTLSVLLAIIDREVDGR